MKLLIIAITLFELFRSTRGMEQVEHMKQVWPIIQKADMPLSAFRRVFLFHLFRLSHSFRGTEQGQWSGPIDTAAPRPLQEKAVKASSLR